MEHETAATRRRDGIPLHRDVVAYLDGLAAELGVPSDVAARASSSPPS
jgi:hypothetical protein